MKREKAEKMMNLEHRMRDQAQHNQYEIDQIQQHTQKLLKEKPVVVKSIENNEFLTMIQNEHAINNKIMEFKEKEINK